MKQDKQGKVKITYLNPNVPNPPKYSQTVDAKALDTAQDTLKSMGYEIKRSQKVS